MKKTNLLKSVAALAATASLCTLMTGAIPSNNHKNYFTNSITANAASISRDLLNGSDMFFKQDTKINCTHASITMLLRRVSRINDGDYASITQDSTRSTVWISDKVGADHDFIYQGMQISYCTKEDVYNQLSKYNGSRKELFKALLKEHPEGIVAYDSWHLAGGGDYPSLWYPQAPNQVADDRTDHAILLTDYDEATDTFYAADPADAALAKRIKLSDTTRNHIDYFDTYWYYTGTLSNQVTNSNNPNTNNNTVVQTPTQSSGVTPIFLTNNVLFKNVTYPIKQKAGDIFNVYGTITTSSKITSVTVDIDEITATGSYVNVDKTVRYPNTTYYNLHTIDDRIWFNRASKKNTSYRYRITVKTANGKTAYHTKTFKTF